MNTSFLFILFFGVSIFLQWTVCYKYKWHFHYSFSNTDLFSALKNVSTQLEEALHVYFLSCSLQNFFLLYGLTVIRSLQINTNTVLSLICSFTTNTFLKIAFWFNLPRTVDFATETAWFIALKTVFVQLLYHLYGKELIAFEPLNIRK